MGAVKAYYTEIQIALETGNYPKAVDLIDAWTTDKATRYEIAYFVIEGLAYSIRGQKPKEEKCSNKDKEAK